MVATIVVVAAVLVTAALLVWFVRARHPEQASRHRDTALDTASDRVYGKNPPGPAGADAERQDPDQPGSRRDVEPPRA